jgi:3'-phosphoadenosine 5'-phosphosulfate sulfotransferase (PAPS reductase)/FAD synthetase
MKPANIDLLIEKYYAGETSVQEETELRKYFDTQEVPESQMADRMYFAMLDELSDEKLGDEFDEKLVSRLTEEKPPSTFRIWSYRISSVAAVILLMLAIWFGTDLLQPKQVYGTITDPKLAFAETQKVLDEVSKKMNKGLQPAKKTVEAVEVNVKQAGKMNKMNSALKQAKKINKFEEASELLKSISKVQVRLGNS